jgi:hypothetical protein
MAKPDHIKVGTSEFARFKYTLYLNTKPTRDQIVPCHNNVPTYLPGQVVSGYCELEVEERSFVRGIWIKLQGEENVYYKQSQFNQYLKSCPPEEVKSLINTFQSSQSFEMKFDIFEQYAIKLKRIVSILERRLVVEAGHGNGTTCPPSPEAVPSNRDDDLPRPASSRRGSREIVSLASLVTNRSLNVNDGYDSEEADNIIQRSSRAESATTAEPVEHSQARQARIDALKEQLANCNRALQTIDVSVVPPVNHLLW